MEKFKLIILASVIWVFPIEPAMAKSQNPPGCKNSGPTAHNPNCSGGSGTHVPATPDKPPVNVDTTTHMNSGGGSAPTITSTPQAAGAGASNTNLNTISGALGNQGNNKPVGNAGGAILAVPTPSTAQPASGGAVTATSIAPAGAPTTPSSSSGAATTASPASTANPAGGTGAVPDHDHGQKLDNYNPNIVPKDPLYVPNLVPSLNAGSDSGSGGNSGSSLPSDIPTIPPTDIRQGQYGAPVSGFDHTGGNTFGKTGGLGYKFVHVQKLDGYARFDTHVPPKPGKNFVPGYRAVLETRDGISSCVMSGMGRRTIINQNGQAISLGHAETIHFRSSSTAHLPSNHQQSSHCLISVQKKATKR